MRVILTAAFSDDAESVVASAMAALEVGYTVHDPALDMLKVEPALDILRSDNRFQELVHRVGLPASYHVWIHAVPC